MGPRIGGGCRSQIQHWGVFDECPCKGASCFFGLLSASAPSWSGGELADLRRSLVRYARYPSSFILASNNSVSYSLSYMVRKMEGDRRAAFTELSVAAGGGVL